ncbi:prepilin peptidase [Methylobrevis albus]|uniref:Prepilin peptidase n=1 Tax=Methylobrevis albus TaxID=2793297 RepID=A0A931MZK8_9HYPH|nr:prepilin peptidase [Methylobrevis albus]MBH0237851.1 prepilin peptidase [Methylobrevis albus]
MTDDAATAPHRRAEWAVAVLAVLAAIGLVAAAAYGVAVPAAAPGAGLVLLAGWIMREDLVRLEIPDGAVLAIGLLGAAVRLGAALPDGLLADAAYELLLDGIICGGGLWLLREAHYRRRGFDGIGLGDVKLAGAGGLLVGTADFAVALLAASLAGLAIFALRRRRAGRAADPEPVADEGAAPGAEQRLAFGALLAPILAGLWCVRQAGF